MTASTYEGQIVDVLNRKIFPGKIFVDNGLIKRVVQDDKAANSQLILPGFIDAHIHIESSMLVPTEFARLAVVHGTVATVSDPHEIGNVLGVEGVKFMIDNANQSPFKFYFGAPSCVPATAYETAGAEITAEDIRFLFQRYELHYLSEMMNFPGVLMRDSEVMNKIKIAKLFQKPVDGHAPGLRGEEAISYINAGISTDHECFTLDEALDKLNGGMEIIIREGSAAKNFEALHPILKSHPDKVMFCSDDKHPDALVEGHINGLVKRAITLGYDRFNVLHAACVKPVHHYALDVGLLQEGDPADFIVADDWVHLNILQTVINGTVVAERGKSLLLPVPVTPINQFNAHPKVPEEFEAVGTGSQLRVIKAIDGELVTEEMLVEPKRNGREIVCDVERDILKLTVVNRYKDEAPAVAFIHGFGLQSGAIASCVAHDSHNILAVGVDSESICAAVNAVIKCRGGIAVVKEGAIDILPLPVAGIMSDADCYHVSEEYARLDRKAKELGSQLGAPFMTLSFMALLVIPSLKLSDKGLFDGNQFKMTNLLL